MLVAPGVPSGTPATMMTRWPALAKPSLNASRQARSTMSSRSCASSATMQCTPQTSDRRRPVESFGRDRHDRRARPLAGDPQSGRARAGPADDGGELERLGDLARRRGDGVGAGRLRLGALGMDDGAIDRIALHLLGDAVHGGDRLDRVLPGRRFRRQHDRIGAFEDRGRNVRHLGAGRHRARDHGFQHLGRDHDRLAGAPRRARVICFCTPGTFSSGISTPRSPRATISASARSMISASRCTACGFSILAITAARPRVIFFASAMSSGRWMKDKRHPVDAGVERGFEIGTVLLGQRRERHRGVGQAHAFAVRQFAADLDAGEDARAVDRRWRRDAPCRRRAAACGRARSRRRFRGAADAPAWRRRGTDRRRARSFRP